MDSKNTKDFEKLDIAQLEAVLDRINLNCSDDDCDRVVMTLHYLTDGSEEGFALVDDWLSKTNGYQNTGETASKWYALENYTEDDISIKTLLDMADGDIHHKEANETQAKPTTHLDKYSLKGKHAELLQDAVKQTFALEPLALIGQATAIFGQPNTGKSLIVLYLSGYAVSQGLIDPLTLYYLNSDDSQAGVLEKLGYADVFGIHTIAEGHQGFSADQFLKILDDMTDNNQAKGVIIILDTGKKFYDPMSKREGRIFGKHIRRFVMRGGTAIVLAHTNKYSDKDGKPIYAGTTDIVEDFDCAYLLYEVGVDADTETKTVLFENIKNRGKVARQATYRYSIAEGLSYREILDSVQPLSDDELSTLKQLVEIESDAAVIEAITQCINDGIDLKMRLAEAAAEKSGVSKRAALKIIEKYTGSDPNVHRWNFEVHERGAKKYRLL